MPRTITKEMYGKAIAYFREHPGDSSGCAKHVGIHYRTARKMWKGPRSLTWPWMEPVEELLARENSLALTAEEEAAELERLEAAREAQKARAAEQQALAFEEQSLAIARLDIIHGLAAINKLTRGVTKLAAQVGELLEEGKGPDGKPIAYDVGKVLGVLRTYTTSVRGLTAATETLVNLGRIQRNLPTAIVGLDVQAMDVREVGRNVEMANRALARARALGIETVVEGRGEELDD